MLFLSSLAISFLGFALSGATLIGYKCAFEGSNITSVSLVTKPSCSIKDVQMNSEKKSVVVTQVSSTGNVTFNRCLVTAQRIVQDCGNFFDSQYEGGIYTEVITLSRDECQGAIQYHEVRLFNTEILLKKE